MKKGVPISPGISVARAFCLNLTLAGKENVLLDYAALNSEVQKFDNAVLDADRDLEGLIERVSSQVGSDEASIFRAHRQFLRDPSLLAKVRGSILNQKKDVSSALQSLLDEYSHLFSQINDLYFQDRMTDLRDVVTRILAKLAIQEKNLLVEPGEPVILVAREILPSQAFCFDRETIAGILTESGGPTGHAAILARSMRIPAVSGIPSILREVHTGDLIALDGREGVVYLNPGPEVESAYRKLQREYVDLYGKLVNNRELKPLSADGIPVELLANVSGPADATMACAVGACGIGLYRTEFLFLTHPSVPTEEDQLRVYREVIEKAPNKKVTIRTLDLGGDKNVAYLGQEVESNPYMGFRSIRLTTAYPEFFKTQLRAILRAGVHGDISLMFPMISTIEEWTQVKQIVEETLLSLQRSGTPHCDRVPVGMMIEVPAAALNIQDFISEVDFVSIGTNDLIQYLMAADRDNPRVAHLCEPFGPALLRLLNFIIQNCNDHGKPVTLCGEMAGRPRCFLPLFGMGLRRLSMSPGFIPSIKELVHRTNLQEAIQITQDILKMKTFEEIRHHLTEMIEEIWPDVQLLDFKS